MYLATREKLESDFKECYRHYDIIFKDIQKNVDRNYLMATNNNRITSDLQIKFKHVCDMF